MKAINYLCIIGLSFLLMSLLACSPYVQRSRSGFDNVETVSLKPLLIGVSSPFEQQTNTWISLVWDETMPKNQNLGILRIDRDFKATNNTTVNMNIDGKKYKFKILNTDNKSTIRSELINYGRSSVTNQEDTLTLYFNIPDAVVSNIGKAENIIVMVNLANNLRIEKPIGGLEKQWFTHFMTTKNKKN